jgi:DNA polymerase elongation subunit (family B)
MKFFTNSKQYGNNILVRGVDNGVRFQDKIAFKPTLFCRTPKEAGFRSLEGESLAPVKMADINAARDYIQNYRDVENFPIFGNTAYQFQWINENYKGLIEYDLDQIKVSSFDIETTVNFGFPDYFNPLEEITLITVRDKSSKAIKTFGCWDYKVKKLNSEYITCRNEVDLLTKFINWVHRDCPDIWTGWNIDGFDIPYLIERARKVVGEDVTKKLSPFGVIKSREQEIKGKITLIFDIYGVATLDYLELYLKFGGTKQESYKLDHVAFKELGHKKIENPYNTFKEFYTNDPELFIDYNIVDVELVDELEDKLKLIELAISMAYMAKINFDDVYSPVKMWDTIIYNHLLDQNIVVPMKRDSMGDTTIEGAFVKPVRKGRYNWLVSFDLASLYPHIIMALNMSPETISKTMIDTTVTELLTGDRSKVPEGFALAPNGSTYDMSKKGFLPALMRQYYMGRKTVKNEMLALMRELEINRSSMPANELRLMENKITAKHNLQLALKIALNSAYGALAQSSFRFFDTRIAEGITMSGQLIIQNAIAAGNVFLNNILKTDEDYVVMADTDSNYFLMENFVNKFYPNKPIEDTVDFLCKACDGRMAKTLNNACDDLAKSMNWNTGLIAFKREAIASSALIVASKNYASLVHDNEGVRYEEPQLKVVGLALVRSSTPEVVKEPLRKCIGVILTGTESTLKKYVEEVEEAYMNIPYADIAFPRGVNNLAKYSSNSTVYVKQHCPIHVRASLLYNNLLRVHKLDNIEPIQEGGKMKFIYLTEPNTLHENVIGFIGKIPEEFNLIRYVDYQTMFNKSFIEPLKKLTEAVGWNYRETASLENLFE